VRCPGATLVGPTDIDAPDRRRGVLGARMGGPTSTPGGVMVSAQETTLQVILEGTKQYQVPLYQRTYSWGKKEQQRLWRDVVE